MKILIRGVAATAVAGALLAGSIATPAVMAEGDPPGIVQTVAAANPLAPEGAEAAWWHIGVRKWGDRCGLIWLNGNRYEVKKQAYGYTSSKPTCQRTGQVITVRIPR